MKSIGLLLASSLVVALIPALAGGTDLPLQRKETEEFLRSARVEAMKELKMGVSGSKRATLDDGERTARAIWKTIDLSQPLKQFNDGGFPQLGFRDSYKSEIAAYGLDKLLGLGLVPPTVERRIKGDRGSLQLWLEEVMTEGERMSQGLAAPDVKGWNEEMHRVRLWHQLIDDSDYNNINNVLVDQDFHLWVIDHSRAFRLGESLINPNILRRFDRQLLERLRGLQFEVLQSQLGRWLTKRQIKTLLLRRDLILERAKQLVAERGEDQALYP